MNKNVNAIVGLFVFLGLVLFAAGLFLIGNREEAFKRHVEYYTEFVNLGGLAKGAKVRVGGMDAGKVLDIGIPSSPSSRFRIELQIDEKLRGLVRTDSLTSIGTEGIVGDTFLSVQPGTANAAAAGAKSTLPSKEPLDITELLDKGNGLLTDADKMIKVTGGKLNTDLDSVNGTIGNVNDVIENIKHGRGTVGMLLENQDLANQVKQTVGSVQQTAGTLNHTVNQADAMVSDLQSRNLPQKVDDTMANIKSASASIDSSAKQLQQTIAEATAPDAQGVTAGVNLQQTLANVNSATAGMADDTEALKHEFFFKGFFKHRGYYDLSSLAPDKYRSDPLFSNPGDHRAWLNADDIFETKPDGSEVISSRGKMLLNDTFSQLGDSALASPIVIEGYSNRTGPGDQLASSRNRSIQVRVYLQNHFQLDPRNMGAVALKSQPPSGIDHQPLDGVCVVVLVPPAKSSKK